MRLHTLQITAFGPFPDTVDIDLDSLSDAGLFLLSGPTGAGKSSILDAISFALYGDVPGIRAGAKRLRCDLADPATVPRVVLEATLGGRRFRIDRSPAWERAKRRGTGLTTEQARVVISERRADGDGEPAWQPLSTRLDETGHLVTRLVGMNLAQFCQVALLPQGRFQAFLRARSEERHALLQQVFQTGRFDQVERWLRDRRIALRRSSETHQDAAADLVSRLSEVAGVTAPEDWPSEVGLLDNWGTSLLTDNDHRCRAAATVRADREGAETETAARLARAQRLAERLAARAAALAELASLDAAAEAHDATLVRLEAARRADSLRPVLALVEAAHDREAVAEIEARESLSALAELVGTDDLDDAAVEQEHRDRVRVLTEVTRVRPLQARAVELDAELHRSRARVEQARRLAAQLIERARALPAEIIDVRGQLDDAARAVNEVPTLTSRVASLRGQQASTRLAQELTATLVEAEADRATTTGELHTAKEAWLDVRELRLDGMAAEIALALVVGDSCPVCGSADHPALASPAADAPDAEAERRARRLVDDLEAILEVRTQHVRDLETRLATAEAGRGMEVVDLAEAIVAAERDLSLAVDSADVAEALRVTLVERETEQARTVAERDARQGDVARAETDVLVLETRHGDAAAQVAAVLDGSQCSSLDELAEQAQRIETACGQRTEATAALARARNATAQARTQAEEVAAAAGFDSPAEATSAWLSPAELSAQQEQVDVHHRALHRVEHTLADPALSQLGDVTAPDMELQTSEHAAAREAAAAARAEHGALAERGTRLTALVTDVTEALAQWAPLRDELELTSSLAGFVEGKSADNRLQMRLSAYVLAHRLSQVVAAANLRLAAMSDQRYTLLHTGQRGAGETRGGLSLLMRDDWSGETRDPATLSGGETFVVSLALALGLADVITAEAGGADLDTLFVDEGFGSLDADTLDDVMDTLDTLRDGGRVVGVVSHVAEMQTRIPTQLRVHKSRQGSWTSQVNG